MFTADVEAKEKALYPLENGLDHYEQEINQLISDNLLTSHFQPIVSLVNQDIYAYEALCRLKKHNNFGTIENLFQQATHCDNTLQLDMKCRENGMCLAASQEIQKGNALLFLNVCSSSLQHPDHSAGTTEFLANKCGIKKNNIVLEITEQDAVYNYQLFERAVHHYRDSGFKIAIDDFGAGYGGLKMLSIIEPDYIKIDRHFFKNSQNGLITYNLIDAIATACHRIGIDVVAEGIETENDVKLCQNLGISLLQGYYFAKPSPELLHIDTIQSIPRIDQAQSTTINFDEVICVGDIAHDVDPISSNDRVLEILNRFNAEPDLLCIPVADDNKLAGLINRQRFMEKHMVGRHGHGLNLNYYKKVVDIIENTFLQVPYYTSVEDVAKLIHQRQNLTIYDDICITKSGKYSGIVHVSSILNAVTENSMMLAKGANPLTGLPGNEFIQREIAKMLSNSIHFDVCYIDIDSFKPFNDKHGFGLGDQVIKAVGNLLTDALKKFNANIVGFAGHIGGDDFILITRPKKSVLACQYIIDQFTVLRQAFHTDDENTHGSYSSINRDGIPHSFNLLSLSIGIVSTEIYNISSFAEVSSISTDLKKLAKGIEGSVIIRDRRNIKD